MNTYTPTEAVEQAEIIEEVNPLDLIAALEDDLQIARTALKRIARANPAALPGGPGNQGFGQKYVVALAKVKEEALTALSKMYHEDE